MKNKILGLLFLVFLILGSGLISCGDGFDCGPFNDKIKLTELSGVISEVVNFSEEDGIADFSGFDGDQIYYDRFAIRVEQDFESYSWNDKSWNFGLISTANACTPPIPRSEEIIDSVVITTNHDFNLDYPLGSDLSNVFDVIVYDEINDINFKKFDLNDFIATEPNVPFVWYLVLKEAPASATNFQFHVQYYQQGIDTDFFEFTTDSIVIEP